jgi:hypothetical protein
MLTPNRAKAINARTKERKAKPRTPYQRGDLMVGYRFELPDGKVESMPSWTDLQLRAGSGWTYVIDQIPISGPIFFQDHENSPWARYSAACAGCWESSKGYRTRHPAIRQWAHRHRCSARAELRGIVHAGPKTLLDNQPTTR